MRTHINTFLILLIVLTAISTSCTSPKGKNAQGQITVEAPIVESCDSMPQDEIFQSVEDPPEYPGGSKALMKYLNDSIRYPQEAKERGIQGRVIVQFVIDTLGNICEERVVRSIDPQLGGEAVRLVRNMPQWKPGKVRGHLQRVRFTIPVTFKLPEEAIKKESPTTQPTNIANQLAGDPRGSVLGDAKSHPLLVLTFPDKAEIAVEGKELNFLDYSEFNYLKAFGLTPEDIEHADTIKHYIARELYGDLAKEGAVMLHIKEKTYHEVTDTLRRYWYLNGHTGRLRVITKKPGSTDAEVMEFESQLEDCFVTYYSHPEFPGGMSALMDYLKANKRYPREAKDRGIQGRIIVEFKVEEDGRLTEERVVRPIDPQLDAEAIRIVRTMPNWEPATQKGKPIRVRFTIPVTFRLSDEK